MLSRMYKTAGMFRKITDEEDGLGKCVQCGQWVEYSMEFSSTHVYNQSVLAVSDMYSEYKAARVRARPNWVPSRIHFLIRSNTSCLRRRQVVFGYVFGLRKCIRVRAYLFGYASIFRLSEYSPNTTQRARLNRPIDGRARSRNTRTNTEYTSAKTLYWMELCVY